MPIAEFLFHAGLNRFLSPAQRARRFACACAVDASVKHMIEALGVPHTEVELILCNGRPVEFAERIRAGDRIDVYPYDALPVMRITQPLRHPPPARFIADAHLGKLARQLRMFGFDVLYRNDYSDAEVARIAASEQRIVLTRDRDLLIRREIEHGCFLRPTTSVEQLREILLRFGLVGSVKAFSRCLACNAPLQPVEKVHVEGRVPPQSLAVYHDFRECSGCARVYWEGSHMARMRVDVKRVLDLCAP